MSKIYNIRHKDGITYIGFTRRPVYKELVKIIDDIAENYPYELRLWDLSVVGLALDNNEIQNIAQHGKKRFTHPSRMAIVAKQDLAYGISRVFEVYRQEIGSGAKVFREMNDAIAWLNSESNSL